MPHFWTGTRCTFGAPFTILKITPAGISSTFAGVSGTTNNGLISPFGLAIDELGNLYVANSGVGGGPGSIERFSPSATHAQFAVTSSSSPKAIVFAVPEPATGLLLAAGAVILLLRRSFRR